MDNSMAHEMEAGLYELQSEVLRKGCMGQYYRVSRGRLGVQTMAHIRI